MSVSSAAWIEYETVGATGYEGGGSTTVAVNPYMVYHRTVAAKFVQ